MPIQDELLHDEKILNQIRLGTLTDDNVAKLYAAFQNLASIKQFIAAVAQLDLPADKLETLTRQVLIAEGRELKAGICRTASRLGKALMIYQARQAGFGRAFSDVQFDDPAALNAAIAATHIPDCLVGHYREVVIPLLCLDKLFLKDIKSATVNHLRFNILGSLLLEQLQQRYPQQAKENVQALGAFNQCFKAVTPTPEVLAFNQRCTAAIWGPISDEATLKLTNALGHLASYLEVRKATFPNADDNRVKIVDGLREALFVLTKNASAEHKLALESFMKQIIAECPPRHFGNYTDSLQFHVACIAEEYKLHSVLSEFSAKQPRDYARYDEHRPKHPPQEPISAKRRLSPPSITS